MNISGKLCLISFKFGCRFELFAVSSFCLHLYDTSYWDDRHASVFPHTGRKIVYFCVAHASPGGFRETEKSQLKIKVKEAFWENNYVDQVQKGKTSGKSTTRQRQEGLRWFQIRACAHAGTHTSSCICTHNRLWSFPHAVAKNPVCWMCWACICALYTYTWRISLICTDKAFWRLDMVWNRVKCSFTTRAERLPLAFRLAMLSTFSKFYTKSSCILHDGLHLAPGLSAFFILFFFRQSGNFVIVNYKNCLNRDEKWQSRSGQNRTSFALNDLVILNFLDSQPFRSETILAKRLNLPPVQSITIGWK